MTGPLPPPPSLSRQELEQSLRDDPIAELGRVGVGSNAVFLALLETSRGRVRAIYKPQRGERPLWDFPEGSLHRREVAAAEVDRALGWGFLPATVLRVDAPLGVGSIQEYVAEPPKGLEIDHDLVEQQLRGLATLDVIINNADRKSAHLLIDERGQLKGIDHGVTFSRDFKLRTVLVDLGGSPVPEVWLAGLRSLLDDQARLLELRTRLRPLLSTPEIRSFEQRARALVASGQLPTLHPWYGRPFEW